MAEVSRFLELTQIETMELLHERGVKGNIDTSYVIYSLEKFVKE